MLLQMLCPMRQFQVFIAVERLSNICKSVPVMVTSFRSGTSGPVQSRPGPSSMSDDADDVSIKSEDVTEDYLRWTPPSEPPKFHMSFAGCGFLGIYHLGVAKALINHGEAFLKHVERFGGASAGSLVAGILAVRGYDDEVVDTCVEWCLDSAKAINKKPLGLLTPRYNLLASLEEFLSSLMPTDAHERASERLFVSLTTLEGKKNVILSKFENNEDVTRALLGSSYVPHITGTKPVKLQGKKYIDGGLTQNLPQMPGASQSVRTVFVSPFSGGYQISPYDKRGKNWVTCINGQNFQVNVDNLIRGYHAFNPPKPTQLKKYYRRGILDTVRFLRRENFYSASTVACPSRELSLSSAEVLDSACRSREGEDLSPDFSDSRQKKHDSNGSVEPPVSPELTTSPVSPEIPVSPAESSSTSATSPIDSQNDSQSTDDLQQPSQKDVNSASASATQVSPSSVSQVSVCADISEKLAREYQENNNSIS